MSNTETLQASVQAFVDQLLSERQQYPADDDSQLQFVWNCLKQIVEKYTTEAYEFNLAMDIFVESSRKSPEPQLETILEKCDPSQKGPEQSIIFAAFYALSLILKKETRVDGLQMLADNTKFRLLGQFPLYFEVLSRYYKRIPDFEKAIEQDERVIGMLKRRKISNAAVGSSYASTVCAMLQRREPKIKPEYIANAKKYINAAIKANPQYPKYYFLKARLIFLSASFEGADYEALKKVAKTARKLIQDAEILLIEFYSNDGQYTESELENYAKFKTDIDEILERKQMPKFHISDDALDQCQEIFMSKATRDDCENGGLPPIPRLDRDDKYFFICYCSKDFKSVFSDLIALYKRKIPFRYDNKLTHGLPWQPQIEKYIGDPDCLGVVFYLSKNNLDSEPISDEIAITEKYNRKYFCVNLEGRKAPSEMLVELLIERHQKDPEHFTIDGAKMLKFLSFFADNLVFTKKNVEDGCDSTAHIDSFIDDLLTKFPELIIGD